MSGSVGNDRTAEPNLTPMLDMVFQLITFFMLVINFKAAALDLSLQLPVIGSAQPIDTKGEEDVLVVNIDSQGQLIIYGKVTELEPFLVREARASRLKLPKAAQADPNAELPTTVVIRADKGVSFKDINNVFTECQKRGFRKFSLKAMSAAEVKKA
ncbi:ExbD/TolR family protein [Planctomicrobium sp. SH668]|uniref:ExbD/TolR family protein n=1 Tax=Planctomicrobium sp. SH668 TaxID=3448126 RepID=UPI003F5C1356